jgi:hypothetical protein
VAAVRGLLDAHVELLKAELAVVGRELGVIVGLAAAAVALAVLTALLLYIGSFLFFGEWLFGSMGWGILHGLLVGILLIGTIGVNLAGGSVRAWTGGVVSGLIVGVLVFVVLMTRIGNVLAEGASGPVEDTLALEPQWVPTLIGLVVGALLGAAAALLLGWRARWRFGRPVPLGIAGAAGGGLLGALLASTRYDNPDGVAGLAVAIGLLSGIAAGAGLAYRRGFDTETRYRRLVPRATMAAFEDTKEVLTAQWQRQRDRFMGR